MPIFEFASDGLRPAESTSFELEQLHERRDIQRVLRERIDALDANLMVLAEESATGRTAHGASICSAWTQPRTSLSSS